MRIVVLWQHAGGRSQHRRHSIRDRCRDGARPPRPRGRRHRRHLRTADRHGCGRQRGGGLGLGGRQRRRHYIFNVWANPLHGRARAGGARSPWTATTCSSPTRTRTSRSMAPAERHRGLASARRLVDSIKSSRYAPAPVGVRPSLIETDNANSVARRPRRLRLDRQRHGGVGPVLGRPPHNVLANRYNGGPGLGQRGADRNRQRRLGVRSRRSSSMRNGNGTAVWSQRNAAGFTDNVWVNRYTPGGGWGSAVPIDGQPEPATQPALGVDATRQAGRGLAADGGLAVAYLGERLPLRQRRVRCAAALMSPGLPSCEAGPACP